MILTENPEDNARAESILLKLREVHNSTQEALRDLRVPENVVQLETRFLPDFTKLLPEEVGIVYLEAKGAAIAYYHTHGFSQREISRRLKGESVLSVNKAIKEMEV